MAIKQLTAFVENKQGKLAEITGLIAANGVDMRALSIADTKDFGILRLIVDDPEKACLALSEAGIIVKITDVIAIELPHRPGTLSKALTALDSADINVEYIYAFLSSKGDGAYMVFRVADNAAAEAVLQEAGFHTLDADKEII